MRVIGTAGHVDHGKSTLVKALTGTHPDRLKEEREREMTIDLGFAWLTLPNGEEVGIIDVPGHRDFIENMLAGVAGIDAVLFVIAADEGVMPQTREHLAILDLLSIGGGLIVLTKIDMVDDPEWLSLVEDEIRQVTRETILANAPIIRVSARSGEGIPVLLNELAALLEPRPPRLDLGRPRLPVDRVFTIAGFGTVVTGTLVDGQLKVGEEIEILPTGIKSRIRGLQTHKQKETAAVPGSRTAVNITGVDVTRIQRGDVITHPGDYQSTRRMDVSFRLLADASSDLIHNMDVKFFIGASEMMARVRLLGVEQLRPGESGWVQLELRDPVVCMRGDRYILRRPSPPETLGGGVVIDPFPKGRHKRFRQAVINQLASLAGGAPEDVFEQALLTGGISPLNQVFQRSHLEPEVAEAASRYLHTSGKLIVLDGELGEADNRNEQLVLHQTYWENICSQIQDIIRQYHHSYPLRSGMPREELKSKIKLPTRPFNAILRRVIGDRTVVDRNGNLALPDHRVHFSAAQQKQVDQLLAQFSKSPYTPPSVKDCILMVGEELYKSLLESEVFVQVSPEVVFLTSTYQEMRELTIRLLRKEGKVTVAQVRDLFDTSRKYALAFMEHCDNMGITVRDGDYRKLRSRYTE
jgi:selenocysteine-specific elongation factor